MEVIFAFMPIGWLVVDDLTFLRIWFVAALGNDHMIFCGEAGPFCFKFETDWFVTGEINFCCGLGGGRVSRTSEMRKWKEKKSKKKKNFKK